MDAVNSRGYRNKNPGNIDYNPRNKWVGQVGIEHTGNPPRFAVFESHEFGIRALAVLLMSYQDRYELRTIRGIISRWAPSSENNTRNYIDHVVKATGFGPDERLDLHTYEHMEPLVKAIITHELGGQPYDQRTIDEGLRRAGITKPVTTLADAATTGTGRGAMAAGSMTTVAGIVAQVATGLQGLDWRVAAILLLVAGGMAVAWVLHGRREATTL
jgi:hypothetical protein